MEKEQVRRSGAAWVPAWVIAGIVAAALLRKGVEDGAVRWWLAPGLGVLAAVLTVLITAASERVKAVFHRAVAALGTGVWMAFVGYGGWSPLAVVLFLAGSAVVAVLEWLLAPAEYITKTTGQAGQVADDGDHRPARVKFWETALRQALKQPVVVHRVDPWERPEDGEQIVVELVGDLTIDSVISVCGTIATKAKLKPNCVVRVIGPGEHQGIVVLDAMLRDCLTDYRLAHEDTTESSIYEKFPLSRSPRGDYPEVCLREKSMLVGGMPGAGKTTFLHRLIMRFARWVDALIWVVDLNGGGVGWPWVEAWARGDAEKPVVDWVADNEYEAAVMIALAQKIAKDRKTSPEARKRKKAKNANVLPVDAKLPAIILVTDEGGEVAQAAGLIGRLVKEGITRTAQIARAEGVRAVMSILRGTTDLLDRGLKTAMGVMLCMRMAYQEEYGHVLGVEPKYKGVMHNGSMFVYRPDQDPVPILTKTEDVDPATIEAHSIATAHLRPDLDERAQKVAERLTVQDVLGGRDPAEHLDIARHPVMRDVEAGRAYSGRWDRAAFKLAEMRGEDVPEFEEPAQPVKPVPVKPTVAPAGSAVEKLLLGTGVLDKEPEPTTPPAPAQPAPAPAPAQPAPAPAPAPAARVSEEDEAAYLLSPEHLSRDADPIRPRAAEPTPGTDLVLVQGQTPQARPAILLVVRDAHPDLLTAAQVRTRIGALGVEVSKQRVDQLLSKLVEQGELVRDDTRAGGPFYGIAGQA